MLRWLQCMPWRMCLLMRMLHPRMLWRHMHLWLHHMVPRTGSNQAAEGATGKELGVGGACSMSLYAHNSTMK